MLRFAADENFNVHIINGVLQRFPSINIVRVQDAAWRRRMILPCWSGRLRKGAFCSLTMSIR